MEKRPRHEGDRLEVLDAFRALAIVVVLGYHLVFLGFLEFAGPNEIVPWWSRLFSYGFLGVEFFFMISGFVIFMTLRRCATSAEFAVRRFARLYPAYLASIPLVFAAMYVFPYPHYQRSSYDLAVAPLVDAPALGATFVSGVYWSLVTEVSFYLMVALVYRFFKTQFIVAWVGVCLLAYAGGLASDSIATISCAPYLPFFTFGIAFYELRSQGHTRGSTALFITGLIGVGLFWVTPTHDTEPVIVLTIFAAFWLLFLLFVRGRLEYLARWPLLFVGRISYALYLVHFEIAIALMSWLKSRDMPPWGAFCIALLAVVALACALTFLVEDRMKRAILRFYARGRRAGSTLLESRGVDLAR